MIFVKRYRFFKLLFIFILITFIGCEKKVESPPVDSALKPIVNMHKSVDFVLGVDNSRSIKPPEQRIIKETILLLTDLADTGDRIAIVAFGQDASVIAAATIESDKDRINFRELVKTKLNFSENFSDIRAGIRTIAEQKNTLFRSSKTSIPVIILLTDGKLEPQDGRVREAFQEMQTILRESLANITINAVLMGETTCMDILFREEERDISGFILMQEFIGRTSDYFFHAKTLDQLLDIGLLILNKAKGVSSLGEKGMTEFRIDDTVELISLIVRKKSTNGDQLCLSSDFRLQWPDMPAGSRVQPGQTTVLPGTNTNISWNSEYEYFDLIMIRNPRPGIWKISSANGRIPEVLNKVVTPIELRCAVRPFYFLNEAAFISAWLYDRKKSAAFEGDYQIQAHLTGDGSLENSQLFIPLSFSSQQHQYILNTPAGILEFLKSRVVPGTISLEFIAQRKRGTGLDPWFKRISPPFRVDLVKSVTEWRQFPGKWVKIPFFRNVISYFKASYAGVLPFEATLDTSNKYYPKFDVPPIITLTIEKYDKSDKVFKYYYHQQLESPVVVQTKLGYPFKVKFNVKGIYRYMYSVEGVTHSGKFYQNSPWFQLTLRWGWEWFMLGSLVLLFFISQWIYRLSGTVTMVTPQNRILKTLRKRKIRVNNKNPSFEFELRLFCFFFFIKRIHIKILKGSGVTLDGVVRPIGKMIKIEPYRRRGPIHRLTFSQPDDQIYTLELVVKIRRVF